MFSVVPPPGVKPGICPSDEHVLFVTLWRHVFSVCNNIFHQLQKKIYGAHGGTRTPNGLPAPSPSVAECSVQLNYMGIDECAYQNGVIKPLTDNSFTAEKEGIEPSALLQAPLSRRTDQPILPFSPSTSWRGEI